MKFRSGKKNRFAWLLAAVAIALASGLVVQQVKRSKLPSHGGKTIAEWFDREVIEESPGCMFAPRSPEFRQAILELGGDAIPFLIEMAQKKESKLADLYDKAVCRLPVQLAMRVSLSDNWEIPRQRSTAINLLGKIMAQNGKSHVSRPSPKQHEAVLNCLVACLRTNETLAIRSAAIRALPALGSETVPSLLCALKENDPAIAGCAATALGQLGVYTPESLAGLQRLALTTEEFELKLACLEAMSRQVSNVPTNERSKVSEALAESLRPLCDIRDRYLRHETAILMWQLGYPEFVTRELSSQQSGNRWFMLDRLKAEGNAAAVFAPEIRGMLDDSSKGYVRESARAVLAAFDDSTP